MYLLLAFICLTILIASSVSGQDTGGALAPGSQAINGRAGVISIQPMQLIGTVDGKTYRTNYGVFGMSWPDTMQYCRTNGMKPATIETAAQTALIYAEASKGIRWYWLNAFRYFTGGSFYWQSNNQPFTYQNWGSGFPIDGNNCMYVGAQALTTNKGWFNNVACNVASTYVLYPLCEDI